MLKWHHLERRGWNVWQKWWWFGGGGGGEGKGMISFIKVIRFHCGCLSCTGKKKKTADDVNPARSCRMGQTNIRLLLSYMLTSSTGPVLRRSGTALFKQSGQIMSREQSQSARERWGKRPRASSRWWEPTQHVWQIRISGDLPNPSTENSFVSSRRCSHAHWSPFDTRSTSIRSNYNNGESSRHDKLLFGKYILARWTLRDH